MSRDRKFDVRKLSIIAITPAPIDITNGLVLDDGINIEKQSADLVSNTVGLGGEVLTSEISNDVHILTLKYLPSAVAVGQLSALKFTSFGIAISNSSEPKYKGIASSCKILNKPDIGISAKKGFSDSVWKILMTDYMESYLI